MRTRYPAAARALMGALPGTSWWGGTVFSPVTLEKHFLLDFSPAQTNDDLYDEIQEKLGFPEFGRNLDAFIDILRGGFGHFEYDEYVNLTVKGRKHVQSSQANGGSMSKWKGIEEVLMESLDGDEMVRSIEWID